MASLSDSKQPPSSENSPPSCKIDNTPQVERQIETPLRKRGGYDCEFVERPKELETDCPICLQILRDPFQVSCCGHSFCQSCIKYVQADKKSCPTCNEVNFGVFPDKRLRRSLYAFQVRCVHQKSGCEWIGELGELDGHLNLNPELGRQLIGCEFADVACTHCREYLQRRHVHAHENESCPQRPFSCDYCEDYGSVYEDVVNNHWPVCKCYPVPCPNECGVSLERQSVETHVNTVCPLTVVNCDFHYAGCEVQLVRKDMLTHLAESLLPHLSLLALHNQQLTQLTTQQKESLEELRKENEALKLQVIQDVETQKERLEESQCKIQEVERENQSQATKLRNCSEAGKRETLKLKSIEQEVVKLSRRKESLEKCQHKIQELEIDLKESSKASEREIKALKQRMSKNEVAALRKQYRNNLSLFSLLCLLCICFSFLLLVFPPRKQASEIESLKLQQDETRSSLAALHVHQQEIKSLKLHQVETRSTLAALHQHTMLPPVQVTLNRFEEMKKNNKHWYSLPFYTHPRGYKMCLKVYANGSGDGKGTHVSVYAYLMRGEFDDHLKWPFQGHVTVAILNQLKDNNHATYTIKFTEATESKHIGRVTIGDRAPSGWGYRTFIAHTDLNYKPAKNCQYLKYDCLRFQIVKVELK